MASESTFSTVRSRAVTNPEGGATHEMIRKRAAQRLVERIDLSSSRHKPQSLLRQEAKRILDQFYETDGALLTRAERDRLTEELLAEVFGYGPLEELFRDDKIVEFMILSHDQIITRDGNYWMPVSVRFRDREYYQLIIEKIRSQSEVIFSAEAVAKGYPSTFDVLLPNGFRAIAICPPMILEQPPQVVFVRMPKSNKTSTITMPRATRPQPPEPVRESQTTPAPVSRVGSDKSQTSVDFNAVQNGSGSASGNTTQRVLDPFERYRMRITERLILRLATAGVYDLSALPKTEMRKAVAMYVLEYNREENLGLTAADEDRLTLAILTSMNPNS